MRDSSEEGDGLTVSQPCPVTDLRGEDALLCSVGRAGAWGWERGGMGTGMGMGRSVFLAAPCSTGHSAAGEWLSNQEQTVLLPRFHVSAKQHWVEDCSRPGRFPCTGEGRKAVHVPHPSLIKKASDMHRQFDHVFFGHSGCAELEGLQHRRDVLSSLGGS